MAEQADQRNWCAKSAGASTLYIWQLLSKDFVMLVLIASVIAIPIAWYLMNSWLRTYQYKINIGVGVFALVMSLPL
jgi:hypothetical protein